MRTSAEGPNGKDLQKRICIGQIDVDARHPDYNAEKMKKIIFEYRAADLIVFPELVVHGHIHSSAPKGEILEMIAQTPPHLKDELHVFARENDTRVIFGELAQDGKEIYNQATYVSRQKVELYAKTHVHWSENFDPGRELRAFDTPLDRIGILICFDSAFPEASRTLAMQGAKIIITIAAVPKSFDMKYMHLRMASIALNNQVYAVFANRAGRHFGGQSAIFSPRGECIARAGQKEEILTAEIDLEEVDIWRGEEPTYPFRRPELYGPIISYPRSAERKDAPPRP